MQYTKGTRKYTFHQYVNIEAMYKMTQSTKAHTPTVKKPVGVS
jgi:hypothetical protein